MEINIRVATIDDVSVLKELVPVSARALSKNYYTPQQIESAIKYIFGVDTQLISDQTYYIAELGGQIVGCGGWSKRKTLFGGDQMKAEGEPLYAAMGYVVTYRFDQPMADGTTLPLAYMKK